MRTRCSRRSSTSGATPRWGRIEETYGEDPFLVTQLGIAAVRGYQGPTLPLAAGKVFATLKHLAGHGSHEGGINTAPTQIPERLLRSELLRPFEIVLRDARAFSIMPSYNEVDGIPSHTNTWLLQDVLRTEWGFTGLIVSDYYGIEQLTTRHRVATDRADAARQAVAAGIDIELPDPHGYQDLPATDHERPADGARPSTPSSSRVLRAKFLAGLFENPYVDAAEAERLANNAEHQAVALDAARRSLVLLKNAGSVLPLDRARIKTLAVIGPNAKGVHLGGYSRDPGRGDRSAERRDDGCGQRRLGGLQRRDTHHRGAAELGPRCRRARRSRVEQAAHPGGRQGRVTSGRHRPGHRHQRIDLARGLGDNHLGDAADLELMGNQNELVDAMLATGKPVVAVLINGRPQAIPAVAARVPAILEAWYAGQEAGTAIGEALFGTINPGGKLPVSFPRDTGQVPVYYNRRPTSFRWYVDLTREPLWPFGHGLSYTTFSVTNARVTPAAIGPADRATVTVDVANTGARAGDEVVQLYIRDLVSSVTRPVKELAAFERVTLRPGEKRTVTFTIGADALSLVDRNMRRIVEPGTFDLMIGTSSATTLTTTLEVLAR